MSSFLVVPVRGMSSHSGTDHVPQFKEDQDPFPSSGSRSRLVKEIMMKTKSINKLTISDREKVEMILICSHVRKKLSPFGQRAQIIAHHQTGGNLM